MSRLSCWLLDLRTRTLTSLSGSTWAPYCSSGWTGSVLSSRTALPLGGAPAAPAAPLSSAPATSVLARATGIESCGNLTLQGSAGDGWTTAPGPSSRLKSPQQGASATPARVVGDT